MVQNIGISKHETPGTILLMFFPSSSFFSGISWVLLLLVFVLSLFVAIYDHRKFTAELAKAAKERKRQIRIRRALVWAIPVATLLLAITSRFASSRITEELETVRHQVEPRTITIEQERNLLGILKPASQDTVLVWWWPIKSVEHRNYAERIANVLLAAGFKVECRGRPDRLFMDGEEGTLIYYVDKSPINENVRRIRSAFSPNGIDAVYEAVSEFEKGEPEFQIVVVNKPAK